MTITQTVDIPADRRLIIDIPREAVGSVVLTFTLDETPDTDDCPICAKHRDPATGQLRFNAETIAAFKEGDAMLRGEIPAKWYNSLDEMLVDLDS